MKLIDYELKKVQITCPNCKYEFPYNKRALENKIKVLGQDIQRVNKKLAIIVNLPEDQVNQIEYKRVKQEYFNLQQLITDYKLIRETLKENEDLTVLANLKMVLKKLGGDDLYKRCMDEALRRSAAYDTEDMMGIGYYSHAGGKRVRKVG